MPTRDQGAALSRSGSRIVQRRASGLHCHGETERLGDKDDKGEERVQTTEASTQEPGTRKPMLPRVRRASMCVVGVLSRLKSVTEERQLAALEALVSARLLLLRDASVDVADDECQNVDAKKDVGTLVEWLVQDVIQPCGERVFPQDEVQGKVHELIHGGAAEALGKALDMSEMGADAEEAQRDLALTLKGALEHGVANGPTKGAGTVDLVMLVLRVLAPRYQMNFGEAVGQILYRHRKADVLQERRHRRALEDMRWMVPGNAKHRAEIHKALEETFETLSIDRNGVLDSRQWHRIARFIQEDPSLKSRLKFTDCDFLFYTGTHHGGDVTVGLSSSEFKSLLAELADTMQVHPYQIFKAAGAFSEHLANRNRSRSPTPPSGN